MKDKNPPRWIEKFFNVIRKSWQYHSPCEHVYTQAEWDAHFNMWQISAAPVYQEVYGGVGDGKTVWAGFIFDVGSFGREDGVWIQEQAVTSICQKCADHPKLMIKGKFRGHSFGLQIYLEPINKSAPVEILDSITKKIREIPEPSTKEGSEDGLTP